MTNPRFVGQQATGEIWSATVLRYSDDALELASLVCFCPGLESCLCGLYGPAVPVHDLSKMVQTVLADGPAGISSQVIESLPRAAKHLALPVSKAAISDLVV